MADTRSRKMASLAYRALEEKKADDIKVLDIENVSTLADYFIIASGKNHNQVQAMADAVDEALGKAGYLPKQTEGYRNANWILQDYGERTVCSMTWKGSGETALQHRLRNWRKRRNKWLSTIIFC